MKKYLLLRENSVSGPFSLETIISMDLTIRDLVWIEDESTSWKPSNEVYELNPFVKSEDELAILKRREERIRNKKSSGIKQDDPSRTPQDYFHIYKNFNSGFQKDQDLPFRYTAHHFRERVTKDHEQKVIWQRPQYPVANLVNVTLVFLVMSFAAFVIKHMVDSFDNNAMIVTGKDYPVMKKNTVTYPAGSTYK